VYPLAEPAYCTSWRHSTDLHRESGCIASTRGDDMRRLRPGDCFRDTLQAAIVKTTPERHLRLV
jgi:hypothetical protein